MTTPDEVTRTGSERTSITMPVDLAEYARKRADGNLSAYLAGLVAEDRRRAQVWERLAEHGYQGDLAPTEEGRRRARARLDEHRAKRARGTGQRAA
jgi:hypothetical protein